MAKPVTNRAASIKQKLLTLAREHVHGFAPHESDLRCMQR
jgi:hypothetical protein